MERRALFVHHRDLRHVDNIGLSQAVKDCREVYPIFIFNPDQIAKNEYYNQRSIDFMISSLKEINVSVFHGYLEKVIPKLVKKYSIEKIYENRDFSPFAIKREKEMKKICKDLGVEYILCEDITLRPMGDFLKKDGNAYRVFTPFFNNAFKIPIPYPEANSRKVSLIKGEHFPAQKNNPVQKAGRRAGLEILKRLDKYKKYNASRDFPAEETTRLGAHLHFGTISVREAYFHIKDALGTKNKLIQQLYWREFYFYIVNYINKDYSKKSATIPAKNAIKWHFDGKKFAAWCKGETGVPIVDAGMRQLNETGWMHNRVRMIVAFYLIWILGIHWSYGEKYFAQNLVDYSYSNNFGGWVWCACIETYSCDPRKIFSMNSQSKKCDPDAKYIKQFIPELRSVDPRFIHDFEKYTAELKAAGYCSLIVSDLKKIREKNMHEFASY